MAIIDTPVSNQKTNDLSIDTSVSGVLVSAGSCLPSEPRDSGPLQEDESGCEDYDLPEDLLSYSLVESGKTPIRWTWGFKTLESLLNEAKGSVTGKAVKFVGRYLRGTKLIFVVGKTGTGKTSMLSELTGTDALQPGTTLKSGTKRYSVHCCLVDDEQYLFIDTAGFGDPDRDDIDTFKESVSSLIAFGSFIEVVGVLYVIGNPGTRLDQQDTKTLRWLQCFCGPNFFRNITVVTGFWDSHSASSFRQAYARMQSLYEDRIMDQIFNPSDSEKVYHGASVYHHGVTDGILTLESFPGLDYDGHRKERQEELKNLIRRRYAQQRYKPVKLQFMQQVERKVPFLETEAAKVLRAPAVGVTVNIVKGKCTVEAIANAQEASPLNFGPIPEVKETSWKETILEWWYVAVKAAEIFEDARRGPGIASTGGRTGIIQGIRNWWNGSSTAGQS